MTAPWPRRRYDSPIANGLIVSAGLQKPCETTWDNDIGVGVLECSADVAEFPLGSRVCPNLMQENGKFHTQLKLYRWGSLECFQKLKLSIEIERLLYGDKVIEQAS